MHQIGLLEIRNEEAMALVSLKRYIVITRCGHFYLWMGRMSRGFKQSEFGQDMKSYDDVAIVGIVIWTWTGMSGSLMGLPRTGRSAEDMHPRVQRRSSMTGLLRVLAAWWHEGLCFMMKAEIQNPPARLGTTILWMLIKPSYEARKTPHSKRQIMARTMFPLLLKKKIVSSLGHHSSSQKVKMLLPSSGSQGKRSVEAS